MRQGAILNVSFEPYFFETHFFQKVYKGHFKMLNVNY